MVTSPAILVAKNIAQVRERIALAASRTGRSIHDIRLVAVTKNVDASIARLLFEAGCSDLGESRPQQFWEKKAALDDLPVDWHLIGHLQRNKVRRTLPGVAWIHSVDSLRLLQMIDQEAALAPCRPNILLEVNISGEAAKHGLQGDELKPLLDAASQCQHVEIRGLMGMASRAGGIDLARRQFSALRELRDRLNPSGFPRLTELSMGMSGDFEVAIEEGATIVRIGSYLLEGILPA